VSENWPKLGTSYLAASTTLYFVYYCSMRTARTHATAIAVVRVICASAF